MTLSEENFEQLLGVLGEITSLSEAVSSLVREMRSRSITTFREADFLSLLREAGFLSASYEEVHERLGPLTKPMARGMLVLRPERVSRDVRDDQTWVVFELSYAGVQLAAQGELESHLREVLRSADLPVFVPSVNYQYGGKAYTFSVMEGYAFCASVLPEQEYLNAVHRSPNLKGVLHYTGGSVTVLQTVSQVAVDELKQSLGKMVAEEVAEGMRVVVTEGDYKNMRGQVVHAEGDDAQVFFDELRTLKIIKEIPRFALRPLGDDE
jgi:hypothetical protein